MRRSGSRCQRVGAPRPPLAFGRLLLCCSVLLGLVITTSACTRKEPPSPQRIPLRVFVDDSLRPAIEQTIPSFNRLLALVNVQCTFGPSGVLAARLRSGEAADVVVFADRRWMALLEADGRVRPDEVRQVGLNNIVMVVPDTSSLFVRGPAEIVDERLERVGIGDPENVPDGAAARARLEADGLWEFIEPRSELFASSPELVEALKLRELDAAFLFGSTALGDVAGFTRIAWAWPISDPVYFAAPVVPPTGESSAMATAFVQHLTTSGFRTTLFHLGFPVE